MGNESPRDLTFTDRRMLSAAPNESDSVLPCLQCVPRACSADLTNDPRVFGENSLSRRLIAFRTISIGAALLSTLSASAMRQSLMSKYMGGVQFAGLAMMTITFTVNLLVFIIMTLEIFHSYRLITIQPK